MTKEYGLLRFFIVLFSFVSFFAFSHGFAFSGREASSEHHSGEGRVLEEKMRELTGRIEELNFQLLQMQNHMDKMKEDNELRFQQLEGKDSASSSAQSDSLSGLPEPPVGKAKNLAHRALVSQGGGEKPPSPPQRKEAVSGKPPALLGTVVFDANGNVVGGSVGDKASVGPDPQSVLPHEEGEEKDPDISLLRKVKDPEELYRRSYNLILSGQHHAAEFGFRRYGENFASHRQIADAQFWLGEALLAQDKYRDAAEIFLRASKKFPKSSRAPDMLLRLGVSLGRLGKKNIACATFDEVSRRYVNLPKALEERVRQEKAVNGC